ncbi:ABC transporter ATP-binding protein [Pseudonocardia sp. KRD291]|uniref:ABC transporter ATP-binding protein n=1 Tax=Pseudonocardia sp. KRD291 TaxID=2792007 RepID=UPI001C49D4F1|nr:ATP-binding cassette domain-containing protein [Pseudonocardia sp. KRD291]MBW0105490.1 ATP-binding cassette domain-containing protein [Pseudonocardia sp. KRD291]
MSVQIRGLSRSFGDRTVLNGVDLDAEPSRVLALLGPNGAGKTTLIRIVATLLRPHGGTVRVAGHEVVTDPVAVRGELSLTGQFTALDDEQTGRENVVMTGRLMHLGRRAARGRATELLERFSLGAAADRRVRTFSGGMRRRLDLAMSLVGSPSVLVLDEPTTGLDPVSRDELWDVVGELAADGTTVLLSTQYLPEADRLADRIAVLHEGRIVADGTADELKSRVGGTRLRMTFDGPGLDRAQELLRDLGPLRDIGRRELDLASDGSAAHLHRLLAELDAAGTLPERVSAHRPGLDDVFRTLTTANDRS